MVTTKLNLSMTEPYVRQIYAKEGDTGRVLEIGLEDYPTENGTLRILRPDGVEVTADALKSADIAPTEPTDLVTFTALEEVPLTKLEVGLEPYQDLHGQSNPYPSGGGKNLLPNKIYKENAYRMQLGISSMSEWVSLKAGTYKLSVGLASGITGATLFWKTEEGSAKESSNITLTEDSNVRVWIFKDGLQTSDVLWWQIEQGSTATSYAPYSNICPIVPSNGVNLIDADTVWSAYRQDDGTFVNPLGTTHYSIPQSLVGKELTFSAKVKANSSSANCRVSASIGGSTNNGNLVNTTDSFTLTSLTITPTSTSDYLVLQSSGDNGTYKEIQLEQGSTATPYVPYQGINVYQSGVNLLDGEYESGSIIATNGKPTPSASYMRTANFIGVLPNTKYYVKASSGVFVKYYDKDYQSITTSWDLNNSNNVEITTNSSARFLKVVFPASMDTSDFSINYPSTDHDYHVYNGTTHSISLGRSVYGGYVDLVSGKLVVDRKLVTYNGSEGWTDYSSFQGYFRQIDDMKTGTRQDGLSNMLVCSKSDASGQKNAFWLGVNSKLMFVIGVYETMGSTSTDFRNYLSTHNLQVMYPIEPTEVDLTPTQISTLLGTNNIFGQTIREVAFEYDGLFAQLPQQATAVVGRCLGDVNFNGASTMPFTLVVKPNNKEVT